MAYAVATYWIIRNILGQLDSHRKILNHPCIRYSISNHPHRYSQLLNHPHLFCKILNQPQSPWRTWNKFSCNGCIMMNQLPYDRSTFKRTQMTVPSSLRDDYPNWHQPFKYLIWQQCLAQVNALMVSHKQFIVKSTRLQDAETPPRNLQETKLLVSSPRSRPNAWAVTHKLPCGLVVTKSRKVIKPWNRNRTHVGIRLPVWRLTLI